jgi:serine/threonine-protein kinase HipA
LKLFITFNEEIIGELIFKNDKFELNYFDSWKENGFELSPHLSFNSVSSENIKNFLQNLLPEGENLNDISIFLQISKYNTFGLIKEIGKDIAGAINFYKEFTDTKGKNFIEISNEELVRKIRNINYENILVWNGKVRLSIAGVGKKLPVMIKDKKMGFGEGKYAFTHILKFNKKELNLVENEYLSLKLARKVGLDVNEVDILKIEDEKILLIKRFDRFYDKNKDMVIKKHIIDGCQILNMPPFYKYQKVFGENSFIEGITVKKLANAINTYCNLKEKDKFISWILFNLIVGNTDAHGKNISFYVSRRGISITPFYDILNTAMYDNFYDTKLAMSIGDNFELEKIEYGDLIDLAN